MLNPNEKIIILDTETTNSLDDPFCYDFGFAVLDLDGNIYETHSYVVADIFLDDELMDSAFFKDKIPQYWADIKAGTRTLKQFKSIRKIFKDVCEKYNIHIVAAHNARFDYRSVNLTQRMLTSSKWRYFFPYGIEIWDTLKMSREIFKDEAYDTFCYENNYLTKRGCKRYTAEIIYRFFYFSPKTNSLSFSENCTLVEDSGLRYTSPSLL